VDANGHASNAAGDFIKLRADTTERLSSFDYLMLLFPLNAAAVCASGLHLVLADHQPPVAPGRQRVAPTRRVCAAHAVLLALCAAAEPGEAGDRGQGHHPRVGVLAEGPQCHLLLRHATPKDHDHC
jgi:hypothetical protein